MENIRLGPFSLDKPIGKGGMGEVWRGRHDRTGEPVAIKVLTREGARKSLYIKSFHNEVSAVCRLHHKGIVHVYDYGVIHRDASLSSKDVLVEGSPYLVMELARYGSLDLYNDQLGWADLRSILLTTLDALAYGHAHGIVHRDLKPQNILLGCGPELRVKLTDFGLAHAMNAEYQKPKIGEQEETLQGGWGTPAYMAPEQFRGNWRDYGPWTDLYALGCMAFELATGELPFHAKDYWEFGRLHMLSEVPRLLPRFAVPEGFEAWVLRLLQKLPHERFQRSADAALALLSIDESTVVQPAARYFINGQVQSDGMVDRNAVTEYDSSDPWELRSRLNTMEEGSLFPDKEKAIAYMTQLVSEEEMSDKLLSDALRSSGEVTADHRLKPQVHNVEAISAAELHQTLSPAIPGHTDSEHALDEDSDWSSGFEEGVAPGTLLDEPISPAQVNLPPMPLSWRLRDDAKPQQALYGAGIGIYELLQPAIVGREVERDLLWQSLREVHASGQPRAVLLRGDSGVGKSMIAKWFCARAHELGVAEVMRAVHSPRRSSYDGLSAMLARYLRVHGAHKDERKKRIREHLDKRWCMEYELVEALEMFIEPPSHPTRSRFSSGVLGNQPARQRLHTLRAFLEHETRDRPLVIFCDDVQWGPEALVMVQNVLTRRTALSLATPVLFVLTLRDDALEVGGLESLLVQQLASLGACYEHTVEPLCRDEARLLVESLLKTKPELTEELIRRAHGIPLFVVQLLGELVHHHKLTLDSEGFSLSSNEALILPDNIHELWQQRVDRCVVRCPGGDQLLLELASALGQDFSFEEWFDIAQMIDKTMDLDFIEGLGIDGLLYFDQDQVSFAHNLLRESLERTSREQGRWKGLHATIANYLETRLNPDETRFSERTRLAEHLLLSGDVHRALPLLLQSARLTLMQGHVERSRRMLQRCESIWASHPFESEEKQARFEQEHRMLQSILLNLEGHSMQARELALKVMQGAHFDGMEGLWLEAALIIAFTSLQLGDTSQSEQLLHSIYARIHDERIAKYNRVILQVWYDLCLGRLLQYKGDLLAAEQQFKTLLGRLPELEFPEALMSTCYNGLGDIYRLLGDDDKAIRFTQEALTFARKQDNPMLMADCYNDLSELYRIREEFESAHDYVNRAIELYEIMGADQALRAHRNLGFLALAEHDFARAYATFDAIHTHVECSQESLQLTFAKAGLLPCVMMLGHHDRMLHHLAELERLLLQTRLRHRDIVFALKLTVVLYDQDVVFTPNSQLLSAHGTLRERLMTLIDTLDVTTS